MTAPTTVTLRRATGLAGMLSAVGLLVALKSLGTAPAHVSALHPSTPTAHAASLRGPRTFSGSLTGSVADTPFGPVQVRLVLREGRIIGVHAIQLPSDASYSREVASYAAPVLRQEVLTAQSAQIDVVSGATYTSEGYAQSLQAALDKLHA